MIALNRRTLLWIAGALVAIVVLTTLVVAVLSAPPASQRADASPTPTPSASRSTPRASPTPSETPRPTAPAVDGPAEVPAPAEPEAGPDASSPRTDLQSSPPTGQQSPPASTGSQLRAPGTPRPITPVPINTTPPPVQCTNVVRIDLRSVGAYTSHYEPGVPGLDTVTGVASIWIRNLSDTPVTVNTASLALASDTGRGFSVPLGSVRVEAQSESYLQIEFTRLTRDEWTAIGSWNHSGGNAQVQWSGSRPAGCIPDAPSAQFLPKSMPSGLDY